MSEAAAESTSTILARAMAQIRRDNQPLGKNIARLRKACGLSQNQLAKAIDVSHTAISLWEQGQGAPSSKVLAKVAEALGVSTDVLLGVKKGRRVNEMDPKTRTLWRRFQKLQQLPERDQRIVIRLLQTLTRVKMAKETSTAPPPR